MIEGNAQATPGEDHWELAPPRFLNRHRLAADHEHVTLVYFATTASGRLGGEAVADGGPECRWFTRDDVETSADLAPWLKAYALAALDALSGS